MLSTNIFIFFLQYPVIYTSFYPNTYANIVGGLLGDQVLQPNLKLTKRYLDSAIALDSALAKNTIQLQIGLSRLYFFEGQYDSAINYAGRALTYVNAPANGKES